MAYDKRKRIEPAPAHLIRLDYEAMFERFSLRTSYEAEKLILMQSVPGHASEGHGLFGGTGLRYVNTTMDDIVLALKQKPTEIKEKRQKIVDDIIYFIDKAIEGKLEYLVNKEGKPLLGMEMFTDMKIKDDKTFLIGSYLASVMDNYEIWRKKIAQKYGLEIGGGKCCAINMKKMILHGEDFDTLSQEEHDEEKFKYLRNLGIISKKKRRKSTKEWQNGYVRQKKGRGVSDDAALLMSGLLYPGKDPCSAALGVYVVDLIDTLDKYIPYIDEGGVDETAGPRIKSSGQISLNEDEIIKVVHLFAIVPRKKMPDCSQRYFLEIDQDVDQTALESHLKYLQGKPYKEMKIGSRSSTRILNTTLYDRIGERLRTLNHL